VYVTPSRSASLNKAVPKPRGGISSRQALTGGYLAVVHDPGKL